MKTTQLDYIIQHYNAGASVQELHRELDLGVHIIKSRLQQAGVKIRSVAETKIAQTNAKLGVDTVRRMVEAYSAGASLQKIGRAEGVSLETAARILRDQAVPLRTMAESTRLANAKPLSREEEVAIVSRYVAGESVPAIAEATGYHPGHLPSARYPSGSGVVGVLRRHGIELRAARYGHQKWWDSMTTLDERREHMAPSQRAGALMRERTMNIKMSPQEGILFGALVVSGVDCVQQRAVDIYNLDISLNEFPIAIEVETGGAFAVSRLSAAKKRIECLVSRGWSVLYVIARRRMLDPRIISEKVISLLEAARRNEPIFGKYGVIDRKGDTITRAHYNIDGVARIPGF